MAVCKNGACRKKADAPPNSIGQVYRVHRFEDKYSMGMKVAAHIENYISQTHKKANQSQSH